MIDLPNSLETTQASFTPEQKAWFIRRQSYLKKLGVVQYRRRSLSVSHISALETVDASRRQNTDVIEPDRRSTLTPAAETISEVLSTVSSRTESRKAERAHLFQGISAKQGERHVEENRAPLAEPSSNTISSSKAILTSKPLDDKNEQPFFDLLIWRTPKLLVLDFSQKEFSLISLKHQLANNILRAIWPSEFKGCEMYQHSWPIKGIPNDVESSRQWFESLVTGYTQQGENLPIWLMGESGLNLIFHDQKRGMDDESKTPTYEELIGTRMRHPTLDAEFLIGPGISKMLESTVAKVQTWQLLNALKSA